MSVVNKGFYSDLCAATPIENDDGRRAWRICFDSVYSPQFDGWCESIGPGFCRKQDSDRAIAVLESLGFTPQTVLETTDDEWKEIRRKIIEAMAW